MTYDSWKARNPADEEIGDDPHLAAVQQSEGNRMISWRHVTRWTRYVPHAHAEDYCRLGWCIADAFDGTPHAAYSVICAWLCACKPVEPRDNRAARRELRP